MPVTGGSPRTCGRPWWRSHPYRLALTVHCPSMSTRMRPTHNSWGNYAELKVLLLKWCRKKGDLWRVESQFCKPQFKFCSVTFPQICFLHTSISAEWGKLEEIKKQFLRKGTNRFHVREHKSTYHTFLGILLCNKCEEPPSSSAGNCNGLVWLLCSGKKNNSTFVKTDSPRFYPGFQDFLTGISTLFWNNTQLSKLWFSPESFMSIRKFEL